MKTKSSALILAALILNAALVAETPAPLSRDKILAEAAAGHLEAVETELIALANGTPADAEASVALAHLRERQNRGKEAVDILDRAIVAYPTRSLLYSELGTAETYRLQGASFMQQAIIACKMKGAYQKSVELDPANVNGWFGLAEYCAQAPAIAGGSMEKAQKYAREIQARDPFLGAMELGSLSMRTGAFDEASRSFAQATKLKPQEPRAWSSLGQAESKLGKTEEARAAFQSALKLDSQSRDALEGLKALAQPIAKTE